MRRIMVRVLGALFVTMLFGVAQLQPSFAQNPTATDKQAPATPVSQWLSVTRVNVKPEMMVEFQNFMKNQTNPALRKGGLKWRDVWQTTNAAGDPFEFIIVAPIEKMAEFDGPNALEKSLGTEGYTAWLLKASSFVKDVHRYVVRTRPDLSFQAKRTGPPKLAVVSSLHVAVNRNNDFENYTKNDFLPVMTQGQVTYLVAQTIFGGDGNEYITLTLRDTFAEIDKGPVVVQVLGAEGAQKLFQKLPAGTVTYIERSLQRFVPELSIMPGESPK